MLVVHHPSCVRKLMFVGTTALTTGVSLYSGAPQVISLRGVSVVVCCGALPFFSPTFRTTELGRYIVETVYRTRTGPFRAPSFDSTTPAAFRSDQQHPGYFGSDTHPRCPEGVTFGLSWAVARSIFGSQFVAMEGNRRAIPIETPALTAINTLQYSVQ